MFKHGDVKFHKELIFNIHKCHFVHCNIHKIFFHSLLTCYFIVLFICLFSHYAFTMCVHYFLLMCAFTFFFLTHFHKYNFDKSKFMLEDYHKSSSTTPMTTPLALCMKYSKKIAANVCKHKLNLWLASTYFARSYDIYFVRRRVLLACTSLVAMGLFIAWN